MDFFRLLRLGSMKEGEKNSREQPKEFWIHCRVVLGQWVCHSPNPMKTDIFADTERQREW